MERNIKKVSKKYKCKQEVYTPIYSYIIAIALGVVLAAWATGQFGTHSQIASVEHLHGTEEHLLADSTAQQHYVVVPSSSINTVIPVPPPNSDQAGYYDQVVESIVTNSKESIQAVLAKSEQKHQIECIAKNIYYESRNQPYSGQVAVAMVTINRSKIKNLPPCNVVYERNERGCQFTWTCTRTPNETQAVNVDGWKSSLVIAYISYNRLVTDLTGGALWYFNPKIAHPQWLKGKAPCNNQYILNGYLGDHRFFRPIINSTTVALNNY